MESLPYPASLLGARSGINFDAQDPRGCVMLERWCWAVVPVRKNYRDTGSILNVI